MENNIISDSCIDYHDEIMQEEAVCRIPFKIMVEDEEIVDERLDTMTLIAKMKATKKKISTACPSPADFLKACKEKTENYIITISSKLSGSWGSAMIAKQVAEEENKKVHIIDSKSAAPAQCLIALKLRELIADKLPTEKIVEKANEYVNKIKTFFILESLDNLAKNGRISNRQALVGKLLHVTPIMCSKDGEIDLKEKVFGRKQAFNRLVEIIGENMAGAKDVVLGITHSNAYNKAVDLKETLMSKFSFKEIHIFRASGLSTAYADDGGIIVAF